MVKTEIIRSKLTQLGVVFSMVIRPIYVESGTYIRIIRTNHAVIDQSNQTFELSYDNLSDKVLDQIIERLGEKILESKPV